MSNQKKTCLGFTKKNKRCNKYPLHGEYYCRSHHPKTLSGKLKISLWSNGILIGSIFAIITLYSGCESEKRITSEFKKHSLAEQLFAGQYNPVTTLGLLEQAVKIANSDPNFEKEFYIAGSGMAVRMSQMIYKQNFKIDFNDLNEEENFEDFLQSGRRKFELDSTAYNYFYILKDGEAIDSVRNRNFTLSRNFPILRPLNVSTIDPTREFLCTSYLDVQIDSIVESKLFLSNAAQDGVFKVRLIYNSQSKSISFDQIEDMFFDSSSLFYSIDQEKSYYEFMLAFFSNSRVRIRDAFTAEEIYVSDPYIPHNLDLNQTHVNIKNKLAILNALGTIQDRWGVYFYRSDISTKELTYMRRIEDSFIGYTRVFKFPFVFAVLGNEAEKIIKKEEIIRKRNYKLVADNYHITLLGEQLNLGQLIISLPPSNMIYRNVKDSVNFEIAPLDQSDSVLYEFPDLKSSGNPGSIKHHYYSLPGDSDTYVVLNGLRLD